MGIIDKQYKCNLCDIAFYYSDSLEQHMSESHKASNGYG